MEDKIIKTSGPGQYLVMFGGVIFLVSALIALNVLGIRGHNGGATQIVGMTFMGLSLIPLGFGLTSYLPRRGTLRLSETGFHDPQMFRNEIPWSALLAVEFGASNNARIEAVRLRVTPEAYEAARVSLLAKLVVANSVDGIGYTQRMIEGTLEDFANEIHAYANEALERGH